MEDDLGIPDRASWLLRSMYPSGTAQGWRGQGCVALLVAGTLASLAAVVIALTLGGDERTDDEPCDQLAIELTYLEAVDSPPADVLAEIDDNRRHQVELSC